MVLSIVVQGLSIKSLVARAKQLEQAYIPMEENNNCVYQAYR